MLSDGHTQMVLLPYHFFLLEALRLISLGHTNNLGILSRAWTKNPGTAVARNSQPSLFSGRLALQPEVLADQG